MEKFEKNVLVSERIKTIREKFGYNRSKLASVLNLSRSAISEFENNIREPSKDFILSLHKLGVSIDWFVSGAGEMMEADRLTSYPFDMSKSPAKEMTSHPFEGAETLSKSIKKSLQPGPSGGTIEAVSEDRGPPGSAEDTAEERGVTTVAERTETVPEAVKRRLPVIVEGGEKGVLIPVIGQGLSAGLGFDYDEGEVVRFIKIPAWIARKSPDLVALPIYGDSMEPTMGRGDLAVCDGGGFKDDGIYVLRDEDRGLMFCKRVKWAPGGWTIMSDNPRYEPMKVDDRAIQIVARVIAAVKEVK
jgi:phage repressor protein C with HTH and peptisase S24 domain/transcriptional regulator with XRE-family HTH domain